MLEEVIRTASALTVRWTDVVTPLVTMKDTRDEIDWDLTLHYRSGGIRFRLRRSTLTRKVRSSTLPVYVRIFRLEQHFIHCSVIHFLCCFLLLIRARYFHSPR